MRTGALVLLVALLAPLEGAAQPAIAPDAEIRKILVDRVDAQYEYSNLGGGLLGHALALRAGMDYEAANLGYVETPLGPAMAAMRSVRRPTGMLGVDIALGWHVLTANGKDLIWHNGGTAGYRTFIGYDLAARTGVVVLSNAGTAAGPDDIGRHLLDARLPLLAQTAAPKTRTEVAVDPKVYDGYVGRYQLAPAAILTITRTNNQLFVQLTGQPAFEIFPEAPTEYFLKVVDAQLTFETDGQGKATAVVLHQNGRDQRATKVE